MASDPQCNEECYWCDIVLADTGTLIPEIWYLDAEPDYMDAGIVWLPGPTWLATLSAEPGIATAFALTYGGDVEITSELLWTDGWWEMEYVPPLTPGGPGGCKCHLTDRYREMTIADDNPLIVNFTGAGYDPQTTETRCKDCDGDSVYETLAEDDCPTELTEPVADQYIFDDIDLINPDTGFLASTWSLEATSDMSLAENLGTGKVGIYYDVYDLLVLEPDTGYYKETLFNLYHTIYSHDDPTFDEAGLVGTTFVTKVVLADVENEGLRDKFGGEEIDIEDALSADIDDVIAAIAATIVESQYTFKKIKQPSVDVRLFSAFEEGQKEETQTLSIAATSTTTTTY